MGDKILSFLSPLAEGALSALGLILFARHLHGGGQAAVHALGLGLAAAVALLGAPHSPGSSGRATMFPFLLLASVLLLFGRLGDGSLSLWMLALGATVGWGLSRRSGALRLQGAGVLLGGLVALAWELGALSFPPMAMLGGGLVLPGLVPRGGEAAPARSEGPAPKVFLPSLLLIAVMGLATGLWGGLAADFMTRGFLSARLVCLGLVCLCRPALSPKRFPAFFPVLTALLLAAAVVWRFRSGLHPLLEPRLLPWIWSAFAFLLLLATVGLLRGLPRGRMPFLTWAGASLLAIPSMGLIDPTAILLALAFLVLLLAWAFSEPDDPAWAAGRLLSLSAFLLALMAIRPGMDELQRSGRCLQFRPAASFLRLHRASPCPGGMALAREVGGRLLGYRAGREGYIGRGGLMEDADLALVGCWLAPGRERAALVGPHGAFQVPTLLDLDFRRILLDEEESVVGELLSRGLDEGQRRRLDLHSEGLQALLGSGSWQGLDFCLSSLPPSEIGAPMLEALASGLAPFGILGQSFDEDSDGASFLRIVSLWRAVFDDCLVLRGTRGLTLFGGRRGNWDGPRPVLRFEARRWPRPTRPWPPTIPSLPELLPRFLATGAELDGLGAGSHPWSRIPPPRVGGEPLPVWAGVMTRVRDWLVTEEDGSLRFVGFGRVLPGNRPFVVEGSGMELRRVALDGGFTVLPSIWLRGRCGPLRFRWGGLPVPDGELLNRLQAEVAAPSGIPFAAVCFGRNRRFAFRLEGEEAVVELACPSAEGTRFHELELRGPRSGGSDWMLIRGFLSRLRDGDGQIR